ncbi:hypothetical protein [Cardinium endosymbiont of Tipula unca]|uniref:hypothetical protein n=1 Tax=Cardinium endosymbiont of Tipula unca TaxID=3066216 RepID=UPI0030CAEB00
MDSHARERIQNIASKKLVMEKDKSIKIIHNTYTKSRGAPELLDIFCKNCNIYVMTYQKDGLGELLRCYLDRIHLPENLQKRQFEYQKGRKNISLVCHNCNTVIGTPMIYKTENRPAYHMIKEKSSFTKHKLPR